MSNRVIYYNIQAFRSAKMKEQADKNQRDKRIHPQLFTFPSTVTFHGQTSLKQEKEYFHLIHQVDLGRTTRSGGPKFVDNGELFSSVFGSSSALRGSYSLVYMNTSSYNHVPERPHTFPLGKQSTERKHTLIYLNGHIVT